MYDSFDVHINCVYVYRYHQRHCFKSRITDLSDQTQFKNKKSSTSHDMVRHNIITSYASVKYILIW